MATTVPPSTSVWATTSPAGAAEARARRAAAAARCQRRRVTESCLVDAQEVVEAGHHVGPGGEGVGDPAAFEGRPCPLDAFREATRTRGDPRVRVTCEFPHEHGSGPGSSGGTGRACSSLEPGHDRPDVEALGTRPTSPGGDGGDHLVRLGEVQGEDVQVGRTELERGLTHGGRPPRTDVATRHTHRRDHLRPRRRRERSSRASARRATRTAGRAWGARRQAVPGGLEAGQVGSGPHVSGPAPPVSSPRAGRAGDERWPDGGLASVKFLPPGAGVGA